MKYLIFILALLFATPALAQERYASIVMDVSTNEIMLEENANDLRYPASLTKIMTLYILFEEIEEGNLTLESRIPVSRNASRQPPTRIGLRRNSSITVEDAILALVVASANDVATAVAERIGGTESRFAGRMTRTARELGMYNTTFANASGLPNNNNRSTAYDMAVLSMAIWRDFPQYYHYFQTPTFRGHRNHNRLLNVNGIDGLKTGYIRASGFNLATMAEQDNRRIVVVVMGGSTSSSRDNMVLQLVDGAYSEFQRRAVIYQTGLPASDRDVPQ